MCQAYLVKAPHEFRVLATQTEKATYGIRGYLNLPTYDVNEQTCLFFQMRTWYKYYCLLWGKLCSCACISLSLFFSRNEIFVFLAKED